MFQDVPGCSMFLILSTAAKVVAFEFFNEIEKYGYTSMISSIQFITSIQRSAYMLMKTMKK